MRAIILLRFSLALAAIVFASRAQSAPSLFSAEYYCLPVGAQPTSVVTADLNGDGWIDVITALQTTNRVAVRMGTGGGHFGPVTYFACAREPRAMALADFNRDGKLDLAIAAPGSQTFTVLDGSGTGTFSYNHDYFTGGYPGAIVAADFDGDGYPDVVVANATADSLEFFHNGGSSGFAPPVRIPVGSNPVALAVGDLNGDGLPDLVSANRNSSSVSILLAQYGGPPLLASTIPAGSSPVGVALADMDKDGLLDLLTADYAPDNTVSVWRGLGGGSFDNRVPFPTGASPMGITVADFNGDGLLDVATPSKLGRSSSVLLGTGGGSLSTKIDSKAPNNQLGIAAADLDGDGRVDAIGVSGTTNGPSFHFGNGDGTFGDVVSHITGYAAPQGVGIADMDGDHHLDLVATSTSQVIVRKGNGDGTFGSIHATSGFSSAQRLALGDVNHDGLPDAAVMGASSNPAISLGLPGAYLAAPTFYGSGTGTAGALLLQDLNADHFADLLLGEVGGSALEYRHGLSNGQLSDLTFLYPGGINISGIAMGDFIEDGVLDVATVDLYGVALFRGGGGTLTLASGFSLPSLPTGPAVAGDFNEDGHVDLIVNNLAGLTFYPGNGSGGFGTGTTDFTYAVAGDLLAADINRDGHLDLVASLPQADVVAVFLGRGDGTFERELDLGVEGGPQGIALGDLDEDGNLDLAVSEPGSDDVAILFHHASTVAAEPSPVRHLALSAAVPNPSFGSVSLQLNLPTTGQVRLGVYDLQGRLVRELITGELSAGSRRVSWDGKTERGERAPAGVYFVRVAVEHDRAFARIVLMN